MTPRRKWVVLAVLFLGIVIGYVDRGTLNIAAVPLMREFQLPAAAMGTMLSSFFWTYALFQMPAGYVVDRAGMRLAYAVAFVFWSLASAATGLATSPWQILAARMALGLGEAVAPVATMSYIKHAFTDRERGLPSAIYVSGVTAGPAIGAFIGTALLDWYGWRVMFFVTGLAAFVWLIPWLLVAPKEKFAVAAPAAAARAHYGRLVLSPIFWALTISMFVYSYFWYFVLTWVPSYLVLAHGYSNRQMGAAVSIPLAAMSVVSLLSGLLSDWFVRRSSSALAVRKSFVCAGFAIASTMLLLLMPAMKPFVLPVFVLSLSGLGIGGGNFWALAQMASPPDLIGRAIGYQNMVAQTAGIAAPLLTGVLLGPKMDFTTGMIVAGVCPLLAALLVLTLFRQESIERLHADLGRG